ncbi:MAG: STAS/SEC14 domain-containing protein [Xanthobacteraceae bacterium]
MIEQLTDFPGNIVAFICKGRVTRADYEAVLVPAVLQALEAHDKVRLYYETDSDFGGIDPGAMWEDFKIGMENFMRWERVALVTDIEWIKQTVRLWGFLMPAATRVFPPAMQAREWIRAD